MRGIPKMNSEYKYVVLYYDAADRSWTLPFRSYEEAEAYCLKQREYGVTTEIAKLLVEYHDLDEPKQF